VVVDLVRELVGLGHPGVAVAVEALHVLDELVCLVVLVQRVA